MNNNNTMYNIDNLSINIIILNIIITNKIKLSLCFPTTTSRQGKVIYIAHFIFTMVIQSALHKGKDLNNHKKIITTIKPDILTTSDLFWKLIPAAGGIITKRGLPCFV